MLADALFHRNIPAPDEEKHSGASHDQELGSHYEGRLQALLNTVGYTMQPDRMKDLYPSAHEFCTADPELRKLYMRKSRLYRLGLMKTNPENFYEHFVGHLDDAMGTNNLTALKKKLQTSKILKHPTNAAVKILSSFGQRKSR